MPTSDMSETAQPVKSKAISSPISTGGAGESFQSWVGAFYLACALLRALPRGGPQASAAREVRFQRLYEGEPLDDLVVVSDLPSGEAKLAFQIKRDLVFSLNDKTFDDVIKACWDTFKSSRFNPVLDRFGVALGLYSKRIDEYYQTTLTWARCSTTANDFLLRVSTERLAHTAQREFVDLIRTKLELHCGGTVDEEELWRFLKSMVILHFDFQTVGALSHAYLIELLRQALPAERREESPEILDRLVQYAAEGNRSAGSFDSDGLRSRLVGDGFSLLACPDCREDLDRLREHADFVLNDVRNDIGGLVLTRSAVLNSAQEALSKSGLVELIGPPGAGKSAILRAMIEMQRSQGQPLVLASDRITGPGWNAFSSSLQLRHRLGHLLVALSASERPSLFINDIDRITESGERQVVNDLVRAVADLPLTKDGQPRWAVVVSAREDNLQDLHQWFDWAGLGKPKSLSVPELSDEEVDLVSQHSSRLGRILTTKHLAPIIRKPFILALLDDRRMLPGGQGLPPIATEAEVARIWWNRVVGGGGVEGTERQQSLLAFGQRAASAPGRPLAATGMNSSAMSSLELDRVLVRDAGRDVYRFGHDLLEDWTLCRVLDQQREDLPSYLLKIGQPIGLVRSVQLLATATLESSGDTKAWVSLLQQVERSPELSPRWGQAILMAPLLSARASELLEKAQPSLLAEDGRRLADLLVATRTVAVSPDWSLLPVALKVAEQHAELVSLLLSSGLPRWEIWLPFMAWLLNLPNAIPVSLRPEVAKLMEAWQTKSPAAPLREQIGKTALAWLADFAGRS